jgi:hypothetical protein
MSVHGELPHGSGAAPQLPVDRLRPRVGALIPPWLRSVRRVHSLAAIAFALTGAVGVQALRDVPPDPASGARKAASIAVETLVSFERGRVVAELDEEREFLTADYADEYVPAAKEANGNAPRRARLSVIAQVLETGVERAAADQVVLMARIAIISRLPGGTAEKSQRLVRVTMELEGSEWLVADLNTL